MTIPPKSTPLVEMRNISKRFGGVQAVDDVSIDLYPGDVVGLLGHNGAGKSTLIKIISGVVQPDTGSMHLEGAAVRFDGPIADAEAMLQNADVEVELGPVARPAADGAAGQSIYFRDPDGNLVELLTTDA